MVEDLVTPVVLEGIDQQPGGYSIRYRPLPGHPVFELFISAGPDLRERVERKACKLWAKLNRLKGAGAR